MRVKEYHADAEDFAGTSIAGRQRQDYHDRKCANLARRLTDAQSVLLLVSATDEIPVGRYTEVEHL